MFIQHYGVYKDVSLQSQVMVTRVTVRVVGRQKGEQVVLQGKLVEHWLHRGRVPMKRAAAMLGS